jgi:lipopolysaccharide export system permease protein
MIHLPMTLSLYIGRYFLAGIMLAMFGLLTIIGLIDLVELIRRSSGKESIPFTIILEMALLKLPSMAEKILPFATLIGGMLALTKLTKSQELVVTRAAGVSVWQFLSPALILVAVLGIISVMAFNPLSAAMISRFEQVEGKYITGKPSVLAVSSSGLWLRQVEEEEGHVGEYIIHALKISQQDMTLSDVIVFTFDQEKRFVRRIDATSATLGDGFWTLNDVTLSQPGMPSETVPSYRLQTDLGITQIQDSFASPQTTSFWELPRFIDTLEKAGFSAIRHKLHFYSMIATPFMLAGMILLGAIFSLRLPRRGGIPLLIVAGLLTGFIMNFATNLIYAFGMSGSLPIFLSATAPAAITLSVAVALLLHLEDG